MRNKSTLLLMELLVMLLVFALAAALCLQAFAWSKAESRENRDRDRAYGCLQTAAEILKHYRGDYALAAKQLGGSWDGSQWLIFYDADMHATSQAGEFMLVAAPVQQDTPGLAGALLQVQRADGTEFAALTVCWQEVTP